MKGVLGPQWSNGDRVPLSGGPSKWFGESQNLWWWSVLNHLKSYIRPLVNMDLYSLFCLNVLMINLLIADQMIKKLQSLWYCTMADPSACFKKSHRPSKFYVAPCFGTKMVPLISSVGLHGQLSSHLWNICFSTKRKAKRNAFSRKSLFIIWCESCNHM